MAERPQHSRPPLVMDDITGMELEGNRDESVKNNFKGRATWSEIHLGRILDETGSDIECYPWDLVC